MTDARIPERPEEPSDAATMGEFVLGLLPPDEAAEIETRLPREAPLAALHSDWADALTTLAVGRDVVPPSALRARIEGRLFGETRVRPRGIGWLAWFGLGGGAAAAFVAAFLLFLPPAFDPSIHVDILVPSAGLTIAAGADEDTLRIINVAGEPAPGRSFEMWLIVGDAAPVSLGLLPESGSVDLPRPAGLAVGVVIAVSDEPFGGSPTGAPTGTILGAEPLFDI